MGHFRTVFLGCTIFLAGCGSDIQSPDDGATWGRRTGRSSDPEPIGLAAFDDGGVVMVGRYYGEVDFGGGKLPSPNENYQAYVVKYDGRGNHVYSRSFGGEFAEAAVDVATLPGGEAIVTGTFNWPVDFGTGTLLPLGTDIFVLKLDPAGKVLWSQRFGGDGAQRPTALATTADGGAVLVGTTSGKFDAGLGSVVDTSNDSFVLRLDPKGQPVWSDVLANEYGVTVHDVAVHPQDKTIVLGGDYRELLSIAALPEISAINYQDGFLVAYDDSGTAQWNRTLGGSGYVDAVNAIATSRTGSTIFVAGQIENEANLGGGWIGSPERYDSSTYLLAIDTSGKHVASRMYGGPSNDTPYGLAVDAEGSVYVAGEYYERIAFGAVELVSKGNSDAYVGKVRSNLEPAFQQGWGDGERQTAYRVVVDGSGRVYVAGSVFGTVDFGFGPTTSSGYYDTFLLALPR